MLILELLAHNNKDQCMQCMEITGRPIFIQWKDEQNLFQAKLPKIEKAVSDREVGREDREWAYMWISWSVH